MITEYKMAVASSDGVAVDLPFGRAECYLIYVVDEDGRYCLAETREAATETVPERGDCAQSVSGMIGCSGHGHDARAEMLGDCRVVLCAKIGPQARRVLERRAISVFDVNMSIDEAFAKIIPYIDRVDHHRRT